MFNVIINNARGKCINDSAGKKNPKMIDTIIEALSNMIMLNLRCQMTRENKSIHVIYFKKISFKKNILVLIMDGNNEILTIL